jgi:hypothetical protein
MNGSSLWVFFVLEFAQKGIGMASTSRIPNSFLLNHQLAPRRLRTVPDMCSFSRSTRHQIVGGTSEIVELAKSLMAACPSLKAMLLPSHMISKTRSVNK